MLQIKTTPNLYGISLIGDYQDLNCLYDSLSRYLDFYENNNDMFPYHEYEYLLALNYDIRHAYMGTRGVEIMDSNAEAVGMLAENIYNIPSEARKEFAAIRKKHQHGNLYFKVEILYPLVFHYLISLDSILDDYYMPVWFEKGLEFGQPYTKFDAIRDRAQITLLTSLLWDNILQLMGSAWAEAAYSYYEDMEYSASFANHIDALVQWQCAHYHKLTEEQKKAFLTLCLYEIMDAEELNDSPEEYPSASHFYQDAMTVLKSLSGNDPESAATINNLPTVEFFAESFDQYASKKEKMYRDDFEKYLEKTFGKSKTDWSCFEW